MIHEILLLLLDVVKTICFIVMALMSVMQYIYLKRVSQDRQSADSQLSYSNTNERIINQDPHGISRRRYRETTL